MGDINEPNGLFSAWYMTSPIELLIHGCLFIVLIGIRRRNHKVTQTSLVSSRVTGFKAGCATAKPPTAKPPLLLLSYDGATGSLP